MLRDKQPITITIWSCVSLLVLACIGICIYLKWRRITHYQPLINNFINTALPLKLNICDVVNGILKLEFLNLNNAQIENNHIDFELNISVQNKWHSILFNEFKCYLKSEAPPGLFMRFALNLDNYQIILKIRHKLHSKQKWSKYSKPHIVTVPALITSSFFVDDIVQYRQQHDFYLKQGMIVKTLGNNYFGIVETHALQHMNEDEDVEDIMITIHQSRILGHKIQLSTVIHTDRYIDNTLSNFLLLRSSDTKCNHIFVSLRNIYMEYGVRYMDDIEDEYEMFYIGRYVAKNVMDYLYYDSNNRFMLNCLVDAKDGTMTMYQTREYIINSRIESLQSNVIEMTNLSHVDHLCERCDVCNVGISAFDWILKCPQSICDYHIICSMCGNNVILQYVQLMQLLKRILKCYLDDDCIHEVASFTVAPIVQL